MSMPKVTTDIFDNQAGIVQIIGRIGDWHWMFHARGQSWQFGVMEDDSQEASCAVSDDYYIEGAIEPAHQLQNEEASDLAFKCVERFWLEQGRSRYFQDSN